MNAEHILLTIILGLSAWTLQSVVKLREQLASLPCRNCPPRVIAAAAVLAVLVFSAHLSADPVTNATDQAGTTVIVTDQANAAPPETAVGSRNAASDDARSLITTIGGAVPWQTVFDWFAGIALPTLLALWRKHAANSKVLTAVITAVENSSVANQVKKDIHAQAVSSNVQPRLDRVVQSVTQQPADELTGKL